MTPVHTFELVLALTSVALVVTGLVGRTALPPAAALVSGGMVLAVMPGVPAFQLDPDLILALLLPPLLMASAYYTSWRDFRSEAVPILLLAVGAVAFTAACVAFAVHLVAPALPLAACITLGAIVSPPDAVAAKAVLQSLRLPRRLVTILEGESLVNDATGLVIYAAGVTATITGNFDARQEVLRFAWLALGGIAFGFAAGRAVVWLLRRVVHTELAIALSVVSSWAIYLAADLVGVSGVLSVVTAGILFGIRQHDSLDARIRLAGAAVWQTIVYVLEALLFVLIGLALRGVLGDGGVRVLHHALPFMAATVAAVLASRLLWMLSASIIRKIVAVFRKRLQRRESPLEPLVIGWAGMRGVVTLAVALALPSGFPARDQILLAAFAVIVFTVLIQGSTLGPIIRAAGLHEVADASRSSMTEAATRAAVGRVALTTFEGKVGREGTRPHPLTEAYRQRWETMASSDQGPPSAPGRGSHVDAALAAVAASRDELIRLYRTNEVHDGVLRALEQEFDLEELQLRLAAGSTR